MCRLFAWHSKDPISPDLALGEDKPNLISLSKLHRDGWGMAWCDESNQVRSFRDEHPAYSAQTLDVDSSTTAILHLRWATEEISVCIANTHPFVKDTPVGRMAFIHNGGIPRGDLLNSLIDEDLKNGLEGDGDSEQYFAAIISIMRKNGGNLISAYQTFLHSVANLKYSSLNAFLLTSDTLSVVAAYRPENRPASQPENYYDLSWDTDKDGITSIWSAFVRERVSNKVENYSILQIDRKSGDISLHKLIPTTGHSHARF